MSVFVGAVDGGEFCEAAGPAQAGQTRSMFDRNMLMGIGKTMRCLAAILILTICHGGCEGGWANAKVVSRFCQEGNTRKTVIDRRRSKKRARAAVLLMALSQRSW